jgi:hypothetical protein
MRGIGSPGTGFGDQWHPASPGRPHTRMGCPEDGPIRACDELQLPVTEKNADV